MKVLEWDSPDLDLNSIEMMLHDLKQTIHAPRASNVTELKLSAKKSGPTFFRSDVKD